MIHKIYYLLMLLLTMNSYCQIPDFESNYTKKDSANNPLLNTFLKDYEFVLAYSDQCCSKQYQILALKDEKWESWTYSDNFIEYSIKKGSKKVTLDTITTGTFFKGQNVKKSKITKLLSQLTQNDFWKLEHDSLNQSRVIKTYIEGRDTIRKKATITDGTYYVFDIMTKNKCRKIESYCPDYFVKLFPDMIDRKKFIVSRDSFLNWWEKYCR